MDATTTIALRREPGHLTRSLVALLLRLSLGLMFLMLGLQKIDMAKKGEYPGGLTKKIEAVRLPIVHRPLPAANLLVSALPYAEVTIGGLLIVGLFTPLSAALSGLLLLQLICGNLLLEDVSRATARFDYVLVNAGILWLSPVTSNYLSLDGLFFGWFWAPRSEGEFRRDLDLIANR